MENHDGEARHHRLTEGDPGDEQPLVPRCQEKLGPYHCDREDGHLYAHHSTDAKGNEVLWSFKLSPIVPVEPEVETPDWLKDNPKVCTFVKDGIRCILPEGHKSQHDYPDSPYFCYQREVCWGRTSCPRQPACSE